MPIFSASTLGSALAAFIILTPAAVAGGDNPPPYASATEAYRQGASAMKAGEVAAAVPALEYAAKRGVLGAQLKLARLYASGHDVPKDDGKAFFYFSRIADAYADIPSSSPIAKYVGESFVALGQYYVDGIPSRSLSPDPGYAAGLFRHAGAYFGSAEAQYQLGRLYLTGTGVEKNPTIAANWLAMAARKQHAAAQAVLGELLWRGDGVSHRQARGLALLTLANENAQVERPRTRIGSASSIKRPSPTPTTRPANRPRPCCRNSVVRSGRPRPLPRSCRTTRWRRPRRPTPFPSLPGLRCPRHRSLSSVRWMWCHPPPWACPSASALRTLGSTSGPKATAPRRSARDRTVSPSCVGWDRSRM